MPAQRVAVAAQVIGQVGERAGQFDQLVGQRMGKLLIHAKFPSHPLAPRAYFEQSLRILAEIASRATGCVTAPFIRVKSVSERPMA